MHLHRSLSAMLLCLIILSELTAQSLNAHLDRDQLHVSAPRMHFLAGAALARLRDGATVKFEFQLTARSERNGRVLARSQEGFAVSYDLWEEKFAITRLGSSPKSISHLSAAAAEAWCIDNTTLPIAVLSATQPFWIRLDYRADDSSAAGDTSDNSGFTLSGLIDIFSRRTRGEQLHGSEEVGPLNLDRLRK
jgi:hypothetical protein